MASAANFLNENIPDPTDFPPQTVAPGLRKLDATFRCSICGETYDAPVTLPCGHCFCSGCLRLALATKQECPTCRKAANEGHIRPNYAMEEAISAWNEGRAYVLQLIERSQMAISPGLEESPRKRKRGRSPFDIIGRTSPSKSASSAVANRLNGSIKAGANSNDLDSSSDIEGPELANPKPGHMVSCPICSKTVEFQTLNTHLDLGCKDPRQVNAWSQIMQKPKSKTKGKQRHHSDSDEESPLPKVSYATLKERQIKDLLQEHSLSVTGDRNQLEQRHQKWVMLYNANLDRSAANRKTKATLRTELKKWEETIPKRKKTVIPDAKQHVKQHKSEFDRLVNLARGSKQTSSSPGPLPAGDSSQPVSPSRTPAPGQPLTSGSSDDVIVIDK